MLNLLTPETVSQAARENILDGTRVSLDWTLDKPAHPSFRRKQFEQSIINWPMPDGSPKLVNDDVLHFNTQGSSQWDGFRHYGNLKHQVYFNGHTQEDIHNSKKIGIDAWAEHGGIVGRGVLLDYASWAEKTKPTTTLNALESTPILLSDLKQIIAEHDITLRTGDILFIRAGFTKHYNTMSTEEQNAICQRPTPDFIGLEAGLDTIKWMWESEFAAVASDAPSFERGPINGPHADLDHMLHQWLLAGWGMPIGELFDLERLAEVCKEKDRWTFFVSSVPLKVPGGVASPPNAVAIF